MTKIVNQIQQFFFILLGVAIPTSIAITNLLIGLLVLCWFIERKFKYKINVIKSSKWISSILALIALYIMGMFWGDNHINAGWLFQRLGLLLLFPVLATINLSQLTIKRGVIAFLVTAFISALAAILINNNLISPLGEYFSFMTIATAEYRPAFIKYNYHNVLLALATTLSFFILIEKKTKYRYCLLFFIVVYAISIFTESGRAGQVIFNLSSVFYIIYYNRKNLFRLCLFFILLFSFQFIIYNSTNIYKKRIDALSNVIQNNGARGEGKLDDIRYVFIKESFNRILDKPILGYGTGSFGKIFNDEVHSGHKFFDQTTPHNQYLYVWFELGILGLVLLLLIFYHQIKELFRMKDGIHRVILPLSFMFLMLVDSYFFIFTLMSGYIYLFTIYYRYESE